MAKQAPKPFTPGQERMATPVIRLMSIVNTWIFRASGGRLGNKFVGGAPVGLFTVRGRKSGKPRTTPLIYLRDGDNLVLVASKGGMSHHPAWYLNMQAHPEVEVELPDEKRSLVARRATDEEKAKLWPRLLAIYPDYDDYQARTDRNIPVVILSPREGAQD